MLTKLKSLKFWVVIGTGIAIILGCIFQAQQIVTVLFVEIYSCVLAVLCALGVFGSTVNENKTVGEIKDEIIEKIKNDSNDKK